MLYPRFNQSAVRKYALGFFGARGGRNVPIQRRFAEQTVAHTAADGVGRKAVFVQTAQGGFHLFGCEYFGHGAVSFAGVLLFLFYHKPTPIYKKKEIRYNNIDLYLIFLPL